QIEYGHSGKPRKSESIARHFPSDGTNRDAPSDGPSQFGHPRHRAKIPSRPLRRHPYRPPPLLLSHQPHSSSRSGAARVSSGHEPLNPTTLPPPSPTTTRQFSRCASPPASIRG
uniref:Uncharacterized protein n=1 Tax=Aegilops tauschii subsp. strangulata TaxID=200361 RepID=A0A453SCX4_AEGTS